MTVRTIFIVLAIVSCVLEFLGLLAFDKATVSALAFIAAAQLPWKE